MKLRIALMHIVLSPQLDHTCDVVKHGRVKLKRTTKVARDEARRKVGSG